MVAERLYSMAELMHIVMKKREEFDRKLQTSTNHQLMSVKYLYNSSVWERPFCPVKRWDDDILSCGIVSATREGPARPVVYLINMFDLEYGVDLDTVESIMYDTIEVMVLDGWIVD